MGKYDEWIERYESTSLDDIPWELGRAKDVVVELCENRLVPTGATVLDLCCGAGSNTVYIAEHGYRTLGLDIAPAALSYATMKAKEAGVDIGFMIAEAAAIPLLDATIDLVLDIGCFHSLLTEDREPLIKDVVRILKPGGLYHLTVFSKASEHQWNRFDEDDIRAFFVPHLNIEEITHYDGKNRFGESRWFYTVIMRKA